MQHLAPERAELAAQRLRQTAGLLVTLARYTDRREWEDLALGTLKPLQEAMRRYPTGFASHLLVLGQLYAEPREVAVFGHRDDPRTQALLDELKGLPSYAAVALIEDPADPLVVQLPFTQGRTQISGEPTVYVCSRGACRLPVTTPEALREQL